MVEYHIQYDFYAIFLQIANDLFQFRTFPVMFSVWVVTGIGCEEAHRIVVVQQLTAFYHAHISCLVKFKNGHQFHRVNTQILEIGNLFPQAGKSTFVRYAGRFIHGKASDVQFIDYKIFHGDNGLFFDSPVEIITDNSGAVSVFVGGDPPDALPGHSLGVRIQ